MRYSAPDARAISHYGPKFLTNLSCDGVTQVKGEVMEKLHADLPTVRAVVARTRWLGGDQRGGNRVMSVADVLGCRAGSLGEQKRQGSHTPERQQVSNELGRDFMRSVYTRLANYMVCLRQTTCAP